MLSREGKQTDRGAVGAEFIGYNRRRRGCSEFRVTGLV